MKARPTTTSQSIETVNADTTNVLKLTGPHHANTLVMEKEYKSLPTHSILANIISKLGKKVKASESIEEALQRNKRWNANLIALTLYNSHPEDGKRGVAHKRSEAVALYDPFGGGVWGRKKRSIPEFEDFDYEGDAL